MSAELIRWSAIAMMGALMVCGLGWYLAYHRTIRPAILSWVGWTYAYVMALVFVAVSVNLLTGEPITRGQVILTLGLIPATVGILTLTVATSRRRTQEQERVAAVVRNADEVAALLKHTAHLEPCANPDCRRVRARMAAIVTDS